MDEILRLRKFKTSLHNNRTKYIKKQCSIVIGSLGITIKKLQSMPAITPKRTSTVSPLIVIDCSAPITVNIKLAHPQPLHKPLRNIG